MSQLKIPTETCDRMILFADPITAPWLVAQQLVDEMLRLDQWGGSDATSPFKAFLDSNPGPSRYTQGVYLKGSNTAVVLQLTAFLWPHLTPDEQARLVSYVQVHWSTKTNLSGIPPRDYRRLRGHPKFLTETTSPEDIPSSAAFELLSGILTSLIHLEDPENLLPGDATWGPRNNFSWTWAVPLPGFDGVPARSFASLRLDDPTEIEALIKGVWPHLEVADTAKIAGYATFHWTLWCEARAGDQVTKQAEADAASAAEAADGGSPMGSMADPSSPDAIEQASAPLPGVTSASANPMDASSNSEANPSGDPHGTPKLPPELTAIDVYLDHLVNRGVSIDVAAKLAVEIWKETTLGPAACFPSLDSLPPLDSAQPGNTVATVWPPQVTLADIVHGQHRYPGASHPTGYGPAGIRLVGPRSAVAQDATLAQDAALAQDATLAQYAALAQDATLRGAPMTSSLAAHYGATILDGDVIQVSSSVIQVSSSGNGIPVP